VPCFIAEQAGLENARAQPCEILSARQKAIVVTLGLLK